MTGNLSLKIWKNNFDLGDMHFEAKPVMNEFERKCVKSQSEGS